MILPMSTINIWRYSLIRHEFDTSRQTLARSDLAAIAFTAGAGPSGRSGDQWVLNRFRDFACFSRGITGCVFAGRYRAATARERSPHEKNQQFTGWFLKKERLSRIGLSRNRLSTRDQLTFFELGWSQSPALMQRRCRTAVRRLIPPSEN